MQQEHVEYPIISKPGDFIMDNGLLYEINRQIFHPLGYALFLEHPTDKEREEGPELAEFFDHRGIFGVKDIGAVDPEGMIFLDETVEEKTKAFDAFVHKCQDRIGARINGLGYLVQNADVVGMAQRLRACFLAGVGVVRPLDRWADISENTRNAWLTVAKSAHLFGGKT